MVGHFGIKTNLRSRPLGLAISKGLLSNPNFEDFFIAISMIEQTRKLMFGM